MTGGDSSFAPDFTRTPVPALDVLFIIYDTRTHAGVLIGSLPRFFVTGDAHVSPPLKKRLSPPLMSMHSS